MKQKRKEKEGQFYRKKSKDKKNSLDSFQLITDLLTAPRQDNNFNKRGRDIEGV